MKYLVLKENFQYQVHELPFTNVWKPNLLDNKNQLKGKHSFVQNNIGYYQQSDINGLVTLSSNITALLNTYWLLSVLVCTRLL